VRRTIKDILLPVAVAIGLAFVIQAAVAKPYEIPTESMVPTIQAHDRIIANRLIYRFRDIERGDIIVFDPPQAAVRTCGAAGGGNIPYVKRVIGLPGDTVEVRPGGPTLVNGKPFAVEDALTPDYRMPPTTVPPDRLLVLGDNRSRSCDSHQWSDEQGAPAPFVPEDNVIGQAEIIYWPPKHLSFLD
jgi:signal peptidase I